MTAPNRKPGRPRIDKPPKIRARPKRIEGGNVVKVKLDPETMERLDRMAVDRLMTRAGILREMICEHIQDAEDIKDAKRVLASIDSGETKAVRFATKRDFDAKEKS